MTEASIEPFARADLDGLLALVAAEGWTEYTGDAEPPGCSEGLERAGGLWLGIRTRTEGYYERPGASRSLGFASRARSPRPLLLRAKAVPAPPCLSCYSRRPAASRASA